MTVLEWWDVLGVEDLGCGLAFLIGCVPHAVW